MPVRQAGCVAIAGRGILIEGPPGSGKSSLALALIDRGAMLVGDDGVQLEARGADLFARPHRQTRGLLEVRNLGLLPMPVCEEVRVCLWLTLDEAAPRFVEGPEHAEFEGITVPGFRLRPGGPNLAIKVQLALERFGLGEASGHWA